MEMIMPMKDPKEVFTMILSDVRQSAERTAKIYEEISQQAQDPDIKEALEARALISNQDLTRLDECFRLIGEKPMKLSGRLEEVFVEDFRRELAEIQSPAAKRLFLLTKLSHLVHLRIGEYMALIAAADLTGKHGVGVLLESCLADKLTFVERTRRVIRRIAEAKLRERLAA
jgi:ferritin-like metal-binding protein YciE